MTDTPARPPRDIPRVAAPPPLLYGVPLLAGLAAEHFHPAPFLPPRLTAPLGLGLVLVGMIGFAAIAAFRRAHTSPNPWRPSAALVTGGPYRLTRNPMYVGLTALSLGVTCWVNSWWPLLPLPVVLVVMDLGVIRREEAYLERTFGEAYRTYRASVRRWV
ncbi:MAG TPA: isoprenylcysteine carboxylmethyltransferase family protein [Gemmatimonadales bacterium]|nr:isoprenylcysteine carboxylmethyltransferase family protein [Gemmatimonadales bacterium]